MISSGFVEYMNCVQTINHKPVTQNNSAPHQFKNKNNITNSLIALRDKFKSTTTQPTRKRETQY